MNIYTSEVEMLRSQYDDLQSILAKLQWDYVQLERAFNAVNEAKEAKQWVELTPKEVAEIVIYPMNKTADLVRIIEAKLKEKNEH
jgi:chromosome condensin MukBEF ATPase and DNA-binding subunit MukB